MQTSNDHIQILWNKYLSGTATNAELDELIGYIETSANDNAELDFIQQGFAQEQASSSFVAMNDEQKKRLIAQLGFVDIVDEMHNVQPVRVRKMQWRWVAAAILILAIGSGVYYFSNQSSKSSAIIRGTGETSGTVGDIAPGTNKAIWILTDGKQIELDSNVLDMTAKRESTENIGYNELHTPRGGQYQLILPDGSKVWLNAASSIKYPVVFNNKERSVEITGEAYFEVAKNLNAPFSVTARNTSIQVLGTSFNINAYPEEESQRTTLISGSVRVLLNNQEVILKPGQQASIPIIPITKIKQITVQTANIEQEIAWKNGFFNLQDASLEEVARQLERWYDIQVVYKGDLPQRNFEGKLSRGERLSAVLQWFSALGIHNKLEGRILTLSAEE